MTGLDLIRYILINNLENETIDKIFMTDEEAAVKFEVGPATVRAWYELGIVKGVKIGNTIFLPINTENPKGERK